MSPDHITDGAYNRNIDKRLAHNMIWLRETSSRMLLSRAIFPAVVPKISFSAKEREARSSGGFTLKESGTQRPRG